MAFVAAACGDQEPLLLLHASLAAAAAFLFRARLQLTGQLAACAAEDDSPHACFAGGPRRKSPEQTELNRRCAELEDARGTTAFDPWELLELRRRLAALSEPR